MRFFEKVCVCLWAKEIVHLGTVSKWQELAIQTREERRGGNQELGIQPALREATYGLLSPEVEGKQGWERVLGGEKQRPRYKRKKCSMDSFQCCPINCLL